jgi:hypothetical protein
MFTRHCTACDKTQLIFFSQVTGLAATDHGTAVTFTCWCGSEQTWDANPSSTDARVAA